MCSILVVVGLVVLQVDPTFAEKNELIVQLQLAMYVIFQLLQEVVFDVVARSDVLLMPVIDYDNVEVYLHRSVVDPALPLFLDRVFLGLLLNYVVWLLVVAVVIGDIMNDDDFNHYRYLNKCIEKDKYAQLKSRKS